MLGPGVPHRASRPSLLLPVGFRGSPELVTNVSGTGGSCLQSRFFLCPPAPLFYRQPLALSDRGYRQFARDKWRRRIGLQIAPWDADHIPPKRGYLFFIDPSPDNNPRVQFLRGRVCSSRAR